MKFKFWENSKHQEKMYPEEIIRYFEVNKTAASSNFFVILDTESTSLSMEKAQLLSIGAVKIRGNSISVKEAFHYFIQTGKSGQNANVQIHEIMKSGKDEKRPIQEVLLKFLAYIENAVLVAHHADYDISLINKFLSENFPGTRLVNKVIDTAELAIDKDKMQNKNIKPENYSLDALLSKHHIKALERHTALGDAYSTALLFLKLR